VRDGLEPLTPANYVRVTANQLWTNLPLVTAGGLIFSALCAPAFVLGVLGRPVEMGIAFMLLISPGWTALLHMQGAIAEERRASLGMMLRALPRVWRRSVGLGALFLVPLIALQTTLPLLAAPSVPFVAWAGLAADVLGVAVAGAIALYAYPLIALHDAALFNALRNGLILASRYPSNTLGLLGMAVLGGLAVGYVGVALLFFLPAWYGLFVVNNCRLLVEREAGDE